MKESIEFSRERKSGKFYNYKCLKSFLNEKIKFLFIGQCQMDTWHHLRGLPEAFSPRNLEFSNKMVISHDCAK